MTCRPRLPSGSGNFWYRFRKEVGTAPPVPDRITLQPKTLAEAEDKISAGYFVEMSSRLQGLGFQQAGIFLVPELSMWVQGFAKLESRCYAAILERLSTEENGGAGPASSPCVEFMSIYPSGTSLTTTNLSNASGTGQPPLSHYHITRGAAPDMMFQEHMALREELVNEKPLAATPSTFPATVIEDYMKAYAHLRLGKTITRRDFPRLAVRLMIDDYEGLLREIIDTPEC